MKMKNILRDSALGAIRVYQKYISPLFGAKCRFIPTCSAYTYEAIRVHGFFKGTFLGIKRILKCNPFYKPMYDPVPPPKKKKCQ